MRFLKVLKAVFVSFPVRLAKKVVRFFKAIWLFFKALFSLPKEVVRARDSRTNLMNLSIKYRNLTKRIEELEELRRQENVPEDDGATTLGKPLDNLDFVSAMKIEDARKFLSGLSEELILDLFRKSPKDRSARHFLAGAFVGLPNMSVKNIVDIFNNGDFYTREEMTKGGMSEFLKKIKDLPKELGLPTIETNKGNKTKKNKQKKGGK